MDNFYQQFTILFFEAIRKEKTTYKCNVRRNIPFFLKIIFYYEKFLDWTTRRLSKNNLGCFLFYKKNFFLENLEEFAKVFNFLGDGQSRRKFVQYVSFKATQSQGVKLNVDHLSFDADIENLSKCEIGQEVIKEFSNLGDLKLYNLKDYGYDAKLFNNPIGILIDFVYEQYAYKNICRINKGEVVLDCGGATGDTPIYFASKGASQVYVFEFIPSNVKLMKRQIALNPELKSKIEILEMPVWEESNKEISYLDKGNASCVAPLGVYPNTVATLSIDNLVSMRSIEQIDFIKMDIEGAELSALKGGRDTIKKHKPKLAICVYHKNEDLVMIPNYLKSLNPGYQFYFDYYTDIGWEAVLYAVDIDKK